MKIVFIILIFFTTLYCAPAYSKYREFYNSDGSSFLAKASGNEYLHWLETEDGAILKYNPKTKNFEYATIQNNSLVCSGKVYKKDGSIKKAPTFKRLNKDELFNLFLFKQKEKRFRQPYK